MSPWHKIGDPCSYKEKVHPGRERSNARVSIIGEVSEDEKRGNISKERVLRLIGALCLPKRDGRRSLPLGFRRFSSSPRATEGYEGRGVAIGLERGRATRD